MSDGLINRTEALAFPLSYNHYDKKNGDIKFIHGVECYREYIEGLPIIELKHGHWVKVNNKNLNNAWVCSECGHMIYSSEKELMNRFKGCYCGAKMDEEENDKV